MGLFSKAKPDTEELDWQKARVRALEARVEVAEKILADSRMDAVRARDDARRARGEVEHIKLQLADALAENARLATEREVIMRCITGRSDIVDRFIRLDILQNGPIKGGY